MVLALAGRRIDSPDTPRPAFPYKNVEKVQSRVRRLLQEQNVSVLVCSAACGADLIALQAAAALGLRRRIVLPFEPGRFRETSVVDRPGNWGTIFDHVIAATDGAGDLVNLKLDENDEAFVLANRAILDETLKLAEATGDRAAVALVWDGKSKGEGDHTDYFGKAAREHGLEILEVSTL